MCDLVISHHGITCDLTTLDTTCVTAPPIPPVLSEPYWNINLKLYNIYTSELVLGLDGMDLYSIVKCNYLMVHATLSGKILLYKCACKIDLVNKRIIQKQLCIS